MLTKRMKLTEVQPFRTRLKRMTGMKAASYLLVLASTQTVGKLIGGPIRT